MRSAIHGCCEKVWNPPPKNIVFVTKSTRHEAGMLRNSEFLEPAIWCRMR
jgi:hypothetical protein